MSTDPFEPFRAALCRLLWDSYVSGRQCACTPTSGQCSLCEGLALLNLGRWPNHALGEKGLASLDGLKLLVRRFAI